MKGFIKNIILYNYNNLQPGEDDILIEYADEYIKNKEELEVGNLEKFKVVKSGNEFEVVINHNFDIEKLKHISLFKKKELCEIFVDHIDVDGGASAISKSK